MSSAGQSVVLIPPNIVSSVSVWSISLRAGLDDPWGPLQLKILCESHAGINRPRCNGSLGEFSEHGDQENQNDYSILLLLPSSQNKYSLDDTTKKKVISKNFEK